MNIHTNIMTKRETFVFELDPGMETRALRAYQVKINFLSMKMDQVRIDVESQTNLSLGELWWSTHVSRPHIIATATELQEQDEHKNEAELERQRLRCSTWIDKEKLPDDGVLGRVRYIGGDQTRSVSFDMDMPLTEVGDDDSEREFDDMPALEEDCDHPNQGSQNGLAERQVKWASEVLQLAAREKEAGGINIAQQAPMSTSFLQVFFFQNSIVKCVMSFTGLSCQVIRHPPTIKKCRVALHHSAQSFSC